MSATRDALLAQLERDLIGPQGGDDEVLSRVWPSDQYIAGILYPPREEPNPEDDEEAESADEDDGSPGTVVPSSFMRRPSVMGISFAVEGNAPEVVIRARAARYEPRMGEDPQIPEAWQRRPLDPSPPAPVQVSQGLQQIVIPGIGRWWLRGLSQGSRWQVTVAFENTEAPAPGRRYSETAHLFQTGFEVAAGTDTRIVPRLANRTGAHDGMDEDARVNDLIYRDAEEFAVGHTCGTTWRRTGNEVIVASTWIPHHAVRSMSADGHAVFAREAAARSSGGRSPLDATALAEAPDATALRRLLETIPVAYARWLGDVRARVDAETAAGRLTEARAGQARENITIAEGANARIQAGIEALCAPGNDRLRRAFQLSQRAMVLQRCWANNAPTATLLWRPFQLAFQLLSLSGLAFPQLPDGTRNPDRDVMDLLWFPTGGGKTEAYLGLTAFVLLWRRLRGEHPDEGAGVTVLMRYTLRLLTVQQFERAARLIVACEQLRREHPSELGSIPFSIGLWVGNNATPATVRAARTDPLEKKRAQQLARYPTCNERSLKWDPEGNRPSPEFLVRCSERNCPTHGWNLPIWTIDEDIFRAQPSLVIGTLDKFAQIVRKPDSTALFDSRGGPPELIIQDELHLISGPLGTVAGLYESAIDLLCRRDGIGPKILGSTATIRRARDQVLQLFNRDVLQFPPPVLDATDSCFAVVDETSPGRLYVGVSTAGRSPKFMLQAASASLLQGASEDAVVSPADRDPYWTLVAYFNSLRELGGALVMMQDDVLDSMKNYARQHRAAVRTLDEPMELTSRVAQEDIPNRLVELERPYDPKKPPDRQSQQYAIVLATNMISVGVDVPRLGLMVVNGQPKTMAEYIQATSRVGRNRVPGLVVTLYNVGRPRDRSHYEAFRSWHQTLYREVEATSVTPFAPRARDRALHAPLVALVRHLVPGMLEDTEVTVTRRVEIDALIDDLVARAERLDSTERDAVAGELRRFVDAWQDRGPIQRYWNDHDPNNSLLVSAETVASHVAMGQRWRSAARSTPNSMRDVEAQVQFRMAPMLRHKVEGGSR
jgi:hypothetical protein